MSSITIISDAPNCGVTYDRHCDDRNSFIIQATGLLFTGKARSSPLEFAMWQQALCIVLVANTLAYYIKVYSTPKIYVAMGP